MTLTPEEISQKKKKKKIHEEIGNDCGGLTYFIYGDAVV
jgi:hypothetical protein